ncbi:MAG: hypothetical protein ACQESW_03950 [Bacteroidota bacterium]
MNEYPTNWLKTGALLGYLLFLVIWLLSIMDISAITKPLLTGAFFIGFVAWVLTFIDMLSVKFYNKRFWVVSMFILTPLTLPVYWLQRNRLIRLKQKMDKGRQNRENYAFSS